MHYSQLIIQCDNICRSANISSNGSCPSIQRSWYAIFYLNKFLDNSVFVGGFRYVRFIILVAAALYLAFVQARCNIDTSFFLNRLSAYYSIIVFNVAYVEMADHTTSPLLESYLNLMRNQTAFSQSVGSAERIAPDSVSEYNFPHQRNAHTKLSMKAMSFK